MGRKNLRCRVVMVTEMMPVEQGSTGTFAAVRISRFWPKRLVSNQRVISIKSLILRSTSEIPLAPCYQSATMNSNWPVLGEKTGFDQEQSKVGDGRWTKGHSGNPAGRSKRRRLFDDHLREALSAERGAVARRLVERLIGEAAQGNIQALKLVCERIGGKPKNSEEAAIANGDELTLAQVRAKLAEYLSRPEVKRNLQSLLAGDEPKTDTIQ